jgi:putative NADH-flavin reductase
MKIIIFGASGRIGSLLVEQALDAGYMVKAYVRNPSKLEFTHQNLEIIEGELSDFENVRTAIAGVDAVISTLGPPLRRYYEGWAILDAHINIVKAMEMQAVKRFITIATPNVSFYWDISTITIKIPTILAKLFFPKAYKEIVQIGNVVSYSKIDWTIVRFIAPNNKPQTGRVKVTFGETKIKWGISRADIAAYLLLQVEDKQQIFSMPIIGS